MSVSLLESDSEPSGTDFALPLGLADWIKLRKDSREESYFTSEERDLEEEEVSGRPRSSADLFSPSAAAASSPTLVEATSQAPLPSSNPDIGDGAMKTSSASFIDTTGSASQTTTSRMHPAIAFAQAGDRQAPEENESPDDEFVSAESSISPEEQPPLLEEQEETAAGNVVAEDSSAVNEKARRRSSSSSVDPTEEPVDTLASVSPLPPLSPPVDSSPSSVSLASSETSNERQAQPAGEGGEDNDEVFTSPAQQPRDQYTSPAQRSSILSTPDSEGGSLPGAIFDRSLSLTPRTAATSEAGEDLDTMVSTTTPFALGTSVLPLFLDFFHGLSVLAQPMKAKVKKLVSLIEKKLDRRYLEIYIQERGKPTSRLRGILSSAFSIVGRGRKIRRTRIDRLLPEEYDAIFKRTTSAFTEGEGGRGPLSTSRFLKTHNNPLLSLVFRDLLELLRKTRRLAEKENVAYVASWVCINSVKKICEDLNKRKACAQQRSERQEQDDDDKRQPRREESSSCDSEALLEKRKQACIRDMSERCQSRSWKEHQLVLYTEEQAIKEGLFLTTMRTLQPRDIRAILDTIDEGRSPIRTYIGLQISILVFFFLSLSRVYRCLYVSMYVKQSLTTSSQRATTI